MRNPHILLLLFCSITLNSFAQNNVAGTTTNVTRLTVFSPGISYEKSIGKNQTLLGHLFVSTPISYRYSSTFGGDFSISFDPSIVAQYRYYYNYRQRQQKEKRTEQNSLNYFSPFLQTTLTRNSIASDHPIEYKRRLINAVGLVWGMQRNYQRHFSLDINIGAGYLFTTVTAQGTDNPIKMNVGKFNMPGQITLGFWLNQRS